MTVVGITMVRDEADIIEHTLTYMKTQTDAIVIADNLSTDGTTELIHDCLRDFSSATITDDEPAYYQSRKMSWLAAKAFTVFDADWVIPFDADEFWYAPNSQTLAEYLSKIPEEIAVVEAALYDHVATGSDDPIDNPFRRIGWRRRKALELPKVACRPTRPVTIAQGNHNAHYTAERSGGLTVRHFPYRSAAQFISKARNGAAAYAATDLPESAGLHWRNYGRLLETFGEDALSDVFYKWFYSPVPLHDPTLIYDPAPV